MPALTTVCRATVNITTVTMPWRQTNAARSTSHNPAFRSGAEVCLGVCLSLQSAALMSGNSGTDARFPSKVRQNVVVG
jgi:hypothetical protein